MRVLIIEDELKVADFIQKGMQQEGYAVDMARDGEEGAYQVANIEYDAVILDLMLPKLRAWTFWIGIRAHNVSLPVLILTAKGSLEDKVKGLDSGASDYLVKPFAFAELSARIRALLRREIRKPPSFAWLTWK